MPPKTKRADDGAGAAQKKPVGNKGGKAKAKPAPPADADVPAVFPRRTPVIIRAGTNAGKQGVTLGHDSEDGMYEVEMTGGGGMVFLDRKSLLPQYEVTLTLTTLTLTLEMTGAAAWSASNGRVCCRSTRYNSNPP